MKWKNVNDASKQASNMTDDRLGSYFLILPTRWVFSLSLSLSGLAPRLPSRPLSPPLPSLPLLSEFPHAPPTNRAEYPKKYDDRQTDCSQRSFINTA